MGLITKFFSVGFALIAILVGSLTQSDEKAAEAPETVHEAQAQMMEISCHHCHRNITVDISRDSAVCTYCHEVNRFDG